MRASTMLAGAMMAAQGFAVRMKRGRPPGNGAALTRWKRKNRKKPPHMRGRA